MKVMVVGGGGREHALVRKLAQSDHVTEVICAPGNGGTSIGKCRNLPIKADDIPALSKFADEHRIDLTVVGPEKPLCEGIVDRWPWDLRIWGPTAEMALLEGSKIHAVDLCQKLEIPIPLSYICRTIEEAYEAIDALGGRCVVKADGLAAGKGAFMCPDRATARLAAEQMMIGLVLGEAGRFVVVQEWLEGWETSLMVLCAGGEFIPLETAQDYKRIFDGDKGPNTGGMGSFSPVKRFTQELLSKTMEKIVRPIVAATGFRGVLYVALMITKDGPKTLEFNARFGDPELQSVLQRLLSDLFPILYDGAAGRFPTTTTEWAAGAAVTVVLASEGYPDKPRTGDIIRGLKQVARLHPDVNIFHAGTKLDERGILVTSGGRVLNVTARDRTQRLARMKVYRAIREISWPGMQYRQDIAA